MDKVTGYTPNGSLGIYIHIPYCRNKCAYCDFNSRATDPVPEGPYTECLLRELSLLADRESPKERFSGLETVYFGGGTPSLFSPESIVRILDNVFAVIHPNDGIEITIEANPDTVDGKRLKGYRDAGINRLSLGVQSFNDRDLKRVGRTHSARKAECVIQEARDAGFTNLSIDLIFAIPGQTPSDLERSILKALTVRPEHISLYGLTIEHGTPLHTALRNGKLDLTPEEVEVEMYFKAKELLKQAGYEHYEISSFALEGFHSRHNSRYWEGGSYIGLGAGAHSFLRYPGWGRRWWNEQDPERYMELTAAGVAATEGGETLGRDEAMTERLMLGLRRLCGISEEEFRKDFGLSPRSVLEWKRLRELGIVQSANGRITLTEKGIIFSNEIF